MKRTVEAIFVEGVLRPLERLDLNEHQRVRMTIECEEPEPTDRAARLSMLLERLERSPLCFGGKMPPRDSLHEQDSR